MVGAVYFPGHASSKPPRMLILWGELTPQVQLLSQAVVL